MADAEPQVVDNDAMLSALEAQRAAFMAALPVSAETRKDRLTRVGRLLVDNADALCDAMSEDFGHRSKDQSMMTDIVSALGEVKYARKHVEKWMRPEKRSPRFPLGVFGAKARIEYQPLGVVGIIAPWNFPVQLTFSPLADALAAGNRVMIKMSEFTPVTSALVEKLIGESFSPEEIAVFNGGPEVGQAFSGLPFDHLLFTGATSIGKHILHAAADSLTPVTLELGGKSPTIFGESADIEKGTSRVAMGKMMNAGQICLAPDYMMVPEAKEGDVIQGLSAAVGEQYPRLDANDDYTSIINDRHYERLQGYLKDAEEKGAELVEVNPGNEDFSASNKRKMPLTIVRNPTDDMKVMQEEIFGPVLPIKTYKSVDEAIDYVNANDRPLGLYYFGSDSAEEQKVLSKTISGGSTVNDVIFHIAMDELPFGGVGPSGMGSYTGHEGFKTFSHAKSVYSQAKMDVAKMGGFKPPFGKTTKSTIKRELKI
ncbi:coniferyl aldehyde dehydrogenase [Parasphingopyxis sp. CP4]|uniref:coniferyl aldehyde dehydrogenase n=1 Tax=Parasphingopyxis sp. CP4 TaxID=2724527 RepID=UPI0015A4B9C9|nr:coniferyl aldehyde dehydrogenase [Parasphingopyxis sp. CP4]QLC21839.1 coniferyl aldehyde dehydrogenase [Parasphingopyxis sp. CP4]